MISRNLCRSRQRAQQNLPKSPPLYSPRAIAATKDLTRRESTEVPQCAAIEVSEGFAGKLQLVVLDTQTVLDWQYFRHPDWSGWPTPGPDAGWQWIATPAMRDELAHVLARGFGPRWSNPGSMVLEFFDRHVQMHAEAPSPAALARALRCTDADDQKFIDLAVTARAGWLVSRDRAVLKLRRRALALAGVRIVDGPGWHSAWRSSSV
ncbi:PIN domain-containing protein [Ideonella sp. DXS29W]|uniref:PIN domain-containing protein n=1 Tax=Ideonella lacteola TaxID=2984193 RepID=A0ABU9BR64_9BURK